MKSSIIILLCCLAFVGVQAQKITREYNNVPLNDALRQLNEQTEKYNISFLYNELEDFRITTSIRHKTVPEAIRQMIGFYPITLTEQGNNLFVECIGKGKHRFKGRLVDENGQPVKNITISNQ